MRFERLVKFAFYGLFDAVFRRAFAKILNFDSRRRFIFFAIARFYLNLKMRFYGVW